MVVELEVKPHFLELIIEWIKKHLAQLQVWNKIKSIGQLNYFVAGARQIQNLLNQDKHHARNYTAILQVITTSRSYIFATHPKVTWYHINLFGYINT